MKLDHRISSTVLWASVAVFSVGTAACSRNRREAPPAQTTSPTTAAKPSATPTTEPVTLTGCLQAGNGGTYVLTGLNRPKNADSENPVVVANEKLSAAEDAYVLTSDTTADLAKLVGDKVHVEGTVTRASNFPGTKASKGTAGTSDQNGEVRAIESGRVIKEKDLARVHVASVQKIADTCGTRGVGGARRPASRSHRSK
jgi:hypothetical protein